MTADGQTGFGRLYFVAVDAPWATTDDGGACLIAYALPASLCPFELSRGPLPISRVDPSSFSGTQVPDAARVVDRELATADGSPVAVMIGWIKEETRLSHERIAALIGITRQALYAWERGGPMSDAHRQRFLAVYDVLRRAAKRHSTPECLAAWLDLPRGADARTPAQLLEAGEIDRARYLAVSSPAPRLRRAPPSKRPVPPRFRAGAERRPVAEPPDEDAELFERFGEPGADDGKAESSADR